MAPTAANKGLDGTTVVFSGKFPKTNHSALMKLVKKHGGKPEIYVTDACTHLVTSEADIQKASKYKQATAIPGIKVVTCDWLTESIERGTKVDETPFLLPRVTATNTSAKAYVVSNNGTAFGPVDLTSDDNAADDTNMTSKKRSRADSTPDGKPGLTDGVVDEPATKKPKIKGGQQEKSASLHVPVDEAFGNAQSYRVLIMGSQGLYAEGTIMDATLNQTQIGLNANKFYRIQLLANTASEKYHTWTHWGRVGDAGQSKLLGDGSLEDALKQFEAKFKDKSGLKWDQRNDPPKAKKYTFIERDYNVSSSDEEDEAELPGAGSRRGSKQSNASTKSVESTLQKPVQRLMEMIFNKQYFEQTLTELHYDAQKLPLGKLSKRTLNNGFSVLKNLAELIRDPTAASDVPYPTAIENLTNQYYTTIPHVFGRHRPPLINNEAMIKKEIEVLEALTDMEIANEIMKDTKVVDEDGNAMHQLDRLYAGLGMKEMTPLKHEATEFKELEKYLTKLTGSTHGLAFKVQDIFRVARAEEETRFANSKYANLPANLSDRRLLWHGSRCTNYGGILSQGLRIAPPEAPVSGYMFGKGVYLADISSKSANYCFASMSANIGLLLLCEAELGKPMLELKHANADAGTQALGNGHFTTLGRGGMKPVGWKDAGVVHESLKGVMMPDAEMGQETMPPGQMNLGQMSLLYNEYIAYDVAQIRLRYLLRVEMKYGSSY